MSSNDYRQVRDYLRTRVLAFRSDYEEWLGSLEDIGNIPQTVLDRTFHISIGAATSSTLADRNVVDDVNCLVTIFKRAYNRPVESRDDLLQTANCIRLDAINPVNVESYKLLNDGNIEQVLGNSITPVELNANNDNIIKVEIELNVQLWIGVV